jgi:uncharacterized protein YoxC
MVSDLSVVVISLSVIVLCWAVIRVNQKLDEAIHNPLHPNELSSAERESETEQLEMAGTDRRRR